jgi:hypothetical protein
MKKRFQFFLCPSPGVFYIVVNGAVSTTTERTPIQSDPIDWDKIDLRWSRNVKYHGLVRSMAFPIALVKDGAAIARHIYYDLDGIDGKCLFVVEELDTGDWLYKPMFEGMLDFATASDRHHYFQCDIKEGGLGALIKANSNVPQEIALPLTGVSSLATYFSGLRLRNTSILELANDPAAINVWHQMVPTIKVQSSESQIQVDVIPQPAQAGVGATEAYQKFPFYKATIGGVVTVDFDVNITLANPAGSNLAALSFYVVIFRVNAANTAVLETKILFNDPNFTSYIANGAHAKGSVTFNLQAGEKLAYLAGLYQFNGSAGADAFTVSQVYSYSTLTVRYDLQLQNSIVMGRRYFDAYQELISKMCDGLYKGESLYLSSQSTITRDNRPYRTCITSGDGLRGLGTAAKPAVIKTDLDDMFSDADDRWMMGIGVERNTLGEEVARLEHRSYFYRKNDVMLRLEKPVTEFEVVDLTDELANLYKVGTADQTYDGLNGRDEPNQTFQFALPTTSSTKEIDAVTPYRADMYGFEVVRSNLSKKDTTDSSSDNDTFVYEIGASPLTIPVPFGTRTLSAYPLARQQTDPGKSATGLISSDTAFNLSLSPKRNLLRNGAALRAFLNQRLSQSITFQTTDKNADLVSNLGSGQIEEKAPVPVSALDEPLYLSKLFRFKAPVPRGTALNIAATPYGVVEFPVTLSNGKTIMLSGFLHVLVTKPGTNAAGTWELKPHPDTDLSKLSR